jgi:tRNA threonylcarbamoyladenosine biosynthesis protein TsaB
MLIAFDTSTAVASVALYNETGIVAETTWQSHRDQTAHVLPMAQKLLDLQNTGPDKLTGVAVALGPGSFNGLRVGVSTAKGLALALSIPIYGFSSLDILAYHYSYLNGLLCTTVDAGRKRLGAGFYRVKGGNWKRTEEYVNLTITELIERTGQPTFFCGELTAEQRRELGEGLGKNAIILPPAMSLRRAGLLAELAWERLESFDAGEDLANLQPIYLHQPVGNK